ncbi:hypothetical protein [Mycobacterium montefiorense]|uniref:hypothetical protein n=1 Tax=Mycobacterium montefiorense TaxID=154654 RepID=UPI0021DB9AA6|nr:hypothetical protein [Mycobacterium montefiorense]MCV7429443.1 hypothetical protein [Mycobacterium montefiorense]GLE54174.1 hypothetical protein ATCCBAA256_37440 [Mycobacterium montefiorense]
MAVDLTGGIDPAREYMLAQRPQDPEMRDSVSFWVVDDRGEIGLPRIGIEAVGANWDWHDIQVNVAFPDGRVYRLRSNGPSLPAAGPDGLASVLGAGGLVFRCIEPFHTWTMSYDGPAVQTSSSDLVGGKKGGPSVDISFHVEAKMAAPPWVQGALQADADAQLRTSNVGDMMGGPRYEQLFTATAEFHVTGENQQTFTGSGLRIRRTGVRKLAGFWGHCWQSAVFGSGRAFGYIAYPPRPDGEPTFNEGFVFTGDGALIAARVVQAPWLTRLQPPGEDVSLVLETRDSRVGIVEIAGQTVFSTHDIHHDDDMYSMRAMKQEMPSFPALQQAGVRYRWDGEQTYGMLERSNPLDKLARD